MEEYTSRGLRALAVAYEELTGDDPCAEGNGFALVGLLAIFDPPREDTKQTIEDALALGVRVKMVTSDQLAIAKETGRRLGLGDHMYPAKVLQEGSFPGSQHATLDEMIIAADGFVGVFPEHKYDIVKRLQGMGHLCIMTGDGANDAPALSRANVGVAVEDPTDAARGAADIVLTKPGLSTIVHAIHQSHIIFHHMRNYAIYAWWVPVINTPTIVKPYTFTSSLQPAAILPLASASTILCILVGDVPFDGWDKPVEKLWNSWKRSVRWKL